MERSGPGSAWWVRERRWLGALALLAAFAWSFGARTHLALSDPGLAGRPAEAVLRTDPAFLYYVTERIVENGGALPAELRADPNLEWPELTDVAAIETVGQEFFVAWTYLAAGKPMPLHVWSVWVMSAWASLVALGVFGLAFELTGRVRFAALSALLWAAMLGDYRTLGFVLIREDFAFPWIAAHLWLALRAVRTRRWSDVALTGLTALAAAATWHASVFVLLMEAACVFAWFVRSGENPFAAPRAWLALALPLAGSFAVPVLRAKQFALSLPMVLMLALLAAALAARRTPLSRAASIGVAAGAAVALAGASRALSAALGGGLGDYGHVFALLAAKLAHFGHMPADPASLDFDARLLWNGPFQTADALTFTRALLAASLAAVAGLAVALPQWLGRPAERSFALPAAFVALAALATWMVERTAPLYGLTGAALAAALAARIPRPALGTAVLALAVLGHGLEQVATVSQRDWRITWLALPPSAQENVEMLAALRANVPAGEPVASDFLTSAAILAFARRPVLDQPKYETKRSREKIEQFANALYRSTPAELREFLLARRCRWLVVNRPWVGGNAASLGGLRPQDLPRMTDKAVFRMMSDDPRVYAHVPGFALVHESRAELGLRSYRVYRVD